VFKEYEVSYFNWCQIEFEQMLYNLFEFSKFI